jgi:RimJ/RimL family protein N-acetyltransferase
MAHSSLLESLFPPLGLRIQASGTGGSGIELRYPSDDDLAQLIRLAARGIHPPEVMPFAVPWTDLPSPELERRALQYHWGNRASLGPAKWDLSFAVVVDGNIVGSQSLHAIDFPVLRTAETGSWLGAEFQGRGIGKLMRAMVVRFAFEHLGAEAITSGAFLDNPASQHVSIATGYEPNGTSAVVRRGAAAHHQRYLLTRQRWLDTASPLLIEVHGLDPCRELLGCG